MKLKVKQEKGITLIALIVIIIVLLILSAISIAMLTGQNGILGKAAETKKATSAAQLDEQVKLAIMEARLNGLGKIESTEALDSALKRNVGEGNYTLTETSTGWNIETSKKKYELDADGNLTIGDNTPGGEEEEPPIDNSGSLVLGLVDDCGTHSTIYLYGNSDKITSGNITITMPDNTTQTITAVSDNTEISNSANYATFDTQKNGTYTFSVTDGTTTTETKIKVSNIEKFELVDNLGLSYVNSENKAYNYKGAAVPKGFYVDTKTNVDTGLVITDDIDSEGYSTGNEWVWVPVNSTVGNDDFYIEETGTLAGATTVTYNRYSKLYSFSTPKTRDDYGTFYPMGNSSEGIVGIPSKEGGYREPAIITDSTCGESVYYSSIDKRGTTNQCVDVTDVANQYIADYNNMITSVDKYGGFYIGRYELTAEGERQGDSLSIIGWYPLYNECMKFDKDNVTSGMIYGTLWDATMQWLADSGYNVGYTGEKTSGYGIYFEEAVKVNNENCTIIVKPSKRRIGLKTGQTSYTKSNNIYDISGNFSEWTQEAVKVNLRMARGGAYDDSDDSFTFSSSRPNWGNDLAGGGLTVSTRSYLCIN